MSIGQVAVVLGVELQQRLVELAQGRDPHLGRREGVHPYHDTGTAGVVVGVPGQGADLVMGGAGGLEHHLQRQAGFLVQGLGDVVGVIRHLTQGFGTVQVLAANHEPHFQGFHQFHRLVLVINQAGWP